MEKRVPSSAMRELSAWFERECAEHGLLEMTFCPGSDREVGQEEAAQVALAMIRYEPEA